MSAAASELNVRERVSDEEWQQRIDLAACYRMIAMYGWDDLIFTHISARVPGPDEHFLINAYGLLFERFLNPERVSMPDFDVDFCKNRRDEVIRYVADHYGNDRVGQIATFHQLKARSVVRDVGRVLEIPYASCDRLSKMLPDDPKMNLRKALEMNPEFRTAYDNDPECRRILDFGFVLEGLYRNPGTHAGDPWVNPLILSKQASM